MKKTIALILARGGSKGIPKKNIKDFCGMPLIGWSILQAKNTKNISDVWLSSDDDKILKIAEKLGAKTICRPKKLATSSSNGDDAYLHALRFIEKNDCIPDIIIALQATSPIRESKDLKEGLEKFKRGKYDSLFSSCLADDMFIWERDGGKLKSINYDFRKRPRRQDFKDGYIIENGSFYIFTPEIIHKLKNRLGGKIGTYVMEPWKLFELDELSDIKFCELIMKNYILNNKKNIRKKK
ncbi:MAG: acylneuraminate cytidylyltransferase family protein [Candidatus Nitrosopelagicus sp.]|nr:acylneuraminate cytidylyltransferase family protein [Candidatus Nitrosopelagicus sp.]